MPDRSLTEPLTRPPRSRLTSTAAHLTGLPVAERAGSSSTPRRGGVLVTSVGGGVSGEDGCFVAYAAHELRGEITLQLALAEATLADPGADTAVLRDMGQQIIAACQRQERLLEALLTLAHSHHGPLRREPVDLAATAAAALHAHDHHDLKTTTTLKPARTTGDPQLVGRLTDNLVANAIRHNTPGGRLDLATHTTARHATLTIANTGPVIPAGELTRLFQPFQRLNPHQTPTAHGTGLGLAIVQSIADAHHATLTAQAPTHGGLKINIHFPRRAQR